MSDRASLLDGDEVLLVPYVRAQYGRETLYWVWCMVEAEGTSASLFYTQACQREDERGDLVEFVRYFSDPTRTLLTVVRRRDCLPIGLVWFDAVAGQTHGLIGIWYKRHMTRLAREGTRLATGYAFEVLGFHSLMGWTPWKTALRHGLACGWEKIATIPAMITIAGTPHDVYVVRLLRRADWGSPVGLRGAPSTTSATNGSAATGPPQEVTLAEESWDQLWPDLAPIWATEHCLELGPHARLRERELDTAQYAAWDQAGILHGLTARHGGQLVGYYLSVVHPFANAQGILAATVALYYVRPGFRQQGIGRQLVQAMEQHMRDHGVQLLVGVTKVGQGHATLDHCGFAPNELVSTKWIGKE